MAESSVPMIADDTEGLGQIHSFADAVRYAEEAGLAVVKSGEYGDGFSLLKDKNALCGVPFLILSQKFHDGDFSKAFVVLHVVTKHNEKFIIVDGSTGIRDQVELWSNQSKTGHIMGTIVENGLTRSDYEVELPDPKTGELVKSPATTFYLT
jgi:hypothetical protein